MRVLLRCDASPSTGVGHLVRCLSVLEQARSRGHEVLLAGEITGDWARGQVEDAGLDPLYPVLGAEELAALATRVGADLVHADHYALPDEAWEPLREAGVVLSNVEDGEFGRRPADLVIDPTLGAQDRPREDDGSRLLARGSSYAPLRAAILAARDRRRHRAGGLGDRLRVLVVLGGTDAAGVLTPAIHALVSTDLPCDVLAVAPTEADGRLAEGQSTRRVRVLATPVRSDLPRLMADHDLVVSAAGTTVWELCCIGTPMALVTVSANQAPVYDALVAEGAAAGLGSVADLPRTAGALRGLMIDGIRRAELAHTARGLVDGAGAARIVELWEGLVAEASGAAGADAGTSTWAVGGSALGSSWRVRARAAVSDDADLLLAWRNDPGTRTASREQEPVALATHLVWLDTVLHDPTRLLLVGEDATGTPVGTVRWDALDGTEHAGRAQWEVSITVAPEHRGAGAARPLLAAGEQALRAHVPATATLLARVHADNPASRRLFERSGYVLEDAPPDELGFLRYVKD